MGFRFTAVLFVPCARVYARLLLYTHYNIIIYDTIIIIHNPLHMDMYICMFACVYIMYIYLYNVRYNNAAVAAEHQHRMSPHRPFYYYIIKAKLV